MRTSDATADHANIIEDFTQPPKPSSIIVVLKPSTDFRVHLAAASHATSRNSHVLIAVFLRIEATSAALSSKQLSDMKTQREQIHSSETCRKKYGKVDRETCAQQATCNATQCNVSASCYRPALTQSRDGANNI